MLDVLSVSLSLCHRLTMWQNQWVQPNVMILQTSLAIEVCVGLRALSTAQKNNVALARTKACAYLVTNTDSRS